MECEKIKFRDHAEAQKEIDRLRAINQGKKKKRKIPVRSYKCDLCGAFHTTSSPKHNHVIPDAPLTMTKEWDKLLREQRQREEQLNDKLE